MSLPWPCRSHSRRPCPIARQFPRAAAESMSLDCQNHRHAADPHWPMRHSHWPHTLNDYRTPDVEFYSDIEWMYSTGSVDRIVRRRSLRWASVNEREIHILVWVQYFWGHASGLSYRQFIRHQAHCLEHGMSQIQRFTANLNGCR